jgi:hypothetical protein
LQSSGRGKGIEIPRDCVPEPMRYGLVCAGASDG